MTVVDRIKKLCDERKITIAELERITGIGNGVIRRWGDRVPASDKLIDIADYFEVSVDYLLGRTDIRYSGERAAASSDIPYDQMPPEALEELEKYKQYLISQFGKKKQE